MIASDGHSRTMLARWRDRVATIRREVSVLYLAARDPRTPWLARAIALGTVAYALSPLDLIPDVIPVLGYLDDLLIVPLGLLLARRLIPPEVMETHRRAFEAEMSPALSRAGAAIVLGAWLGTAALLVVVMLRVR